jgi:hypothetical protein
MSLADRMTEALFTINALGLPDGLHTGVTVSDYGDGHGRVAVNVHTRDMDSLRAVRRAVGNVRKDESGAGGMFLRGDVEGVKVTIWPPSDTCKQVQTGTKTITREEPVETRTVTEEVPVFEWDCGPILADESEDAVA